MGLDAAFVDPTTLSILSNVVTERVEKVEAIDIWGATTGVGVACGLILSGWLLNHLWWGSVVLTLATGAFIAITVYVAVVTTSRGPSTPRIDLSTGAVVVHPHLANCVVGIDSERACCDAPLNGSSGTAPRGHMRATVR
ncbi:MFS transporter (plasmid) [Rhodococcus erythropolis]|uniref:MFS transporter n=1 Tax=Rhodococcus erythropolis TaxID=1833 RepID=UPI00406BA978